MCAYIHVLLRIAISTLYTFIHHRQIDFMYLCYIIVKDTYPVRGLVICLEPHSW